MIEPDEKLTGAANPGVPVQALLRALPAPGLRAVIERMEDQDLPVGRALNEVGIPEARLSDPAGLVTVAEELALLRRLVPLTRDPWFGLRAGKCYQLPMFGALGAAVQTAPSALDAFQMFLRYLQLSYTHFHVFLNRGPETSSVVMQRTFDPGKLYRYYLLRDMAFAFSACEQIAPGLTRTGLVDIRLSLHPEGDEAPVRNFFGCPVVFNAPRSEMTLYNRALEAPLPHANEHMRAVLEEQCRRELEQLDHHGNLVERIRALLRNDPALITDEEHLARLMAVTPRTLRRYLAWLDTSFQLLRDQVRCERARELLGHTDLAVARIAEVLGYSESAPFVRAFRRWTGTTPRRYRQAGRQPSPVERAVPSQRIKSGLF